MKDNEIISLFEIRDERAIKALSDKYSQRNKMCV